MDPLVVRPGLVIPADELDVRYSRASGPGGQHVNKVESRVDLRFRPDASRSLAPEVREALIARLGPRLTAAGEIVVVAARYRDRLRNVEDARMRLALLIRDALRPRKKRRPTAPTRGSERRRLEAKKRRSETKRRRRGED